jgi:glyoxylase-like metal-dependent hydrolase (beta-lactamase superfamily II)
MESLTVTPNLTMLRVNGWQVYVWRDGDSVTLIDTGAPGSGAEIAAAVTGIDRIVLTHGHVDHCGSAHELRESTGGSVEAGAGDAAVIRGEADMPPPVFEDWELPMWERVTVGLPDAAPPVKVDRELHDATYSTSAAAPTSSRFPGTPKAASPSICRPTASCSPATPSPMSGR